MATWSSRFRSVVDVAHHQSPKHHVRHNFVSASTCLTFTISYRTFHEHKQQVMERNLAVQLDEEHSILRAVGEDTS